MIKRFEPVEGRNAEIIECVMNCPEVISLPDDIQFKIRLSVEEVEENILCYSGTKWVELIVEREADRLDISFRDGGIAFNPLAKDDPDITLSAEERSIGGLGIFMVKKSMDEVLYERRDDRNIFTMKKKI